MSCNYSGYDFGANYPDSVCIDGFLWDADSGEASADGWMYSSGGELPCPECNFEAWLERAADHAGDDGYNAKSLADCPYPTPVEKMKACLQQHADRINEVLKAKWIASFEESQKGTP